MRQRVRLWIVGRRSEESLKTEKKGYWRKLQECEPFVRGSIHITGKKRDGYSLARRDGKQVKNIYFPKGELPAMKRLVGNYKEAKRLLGRIADCEIKLRILAREGASKTK